MSEYKFRFIVDVEGSTEDPDTAGLELGEQLDAWLGEHGEYVFAGPIKYLRSEGRTYGYADMDDIDA